MAEQVAAVSGEPGGKRCRLESQAVANNNNETNNNEPTATQQSQISNSEQQQRTGSHKKKARKKGRKSTLAQPLHGPDSKETSQLAGEHLEGAHAVNVIGGLTNVANKGDAVASSDLVLSGIELAAIERSAVGLSSSDKSAVHSSQAAAHTVIEVSARECAVTGPAQQHSPVRQISGQHLDDGSNPVDGAGAGAAAECQLVDVERLAASVAGAAARDAPGDEERLKDSKIPAAAATSTSTANTPSSSASNSSIGQLPNGQDEKTDTCPLTTRRDTSSSGEPKLTNKSNADQATTKTTINTTNNCSKPSGEQSAANNRNQNQNHHHHRRQASEHLNSVNEQQEAARKSFIKADTLEAGPDGAQAFCKQRRLSYLQSLLLRRWPCLAIGICIMSSLLFGMLLSALTVYLMHGVADCSGLAASLAAAAAAASSSSSSASHAALAGNSPHLARHELALGRPGELDAPIELAASLTASNPNEMALSGRLQAAAGANQEQQQPASRFQRLPTSLWPVHYDLFVQPYIAKPFNFTGKVSIRIKCTNRTDNITLHTLDLDLNEASLSVEAADNETSKAAPRIKGLSQDKQLQYSIIHLDGPLEAGREYVVGIDFVGFLNDDLAGFYKIKYEQQNSSETTWIAATQFQATDARRAFPCFDEPLYKATFSIKIKHWKNMTALSNMPIVDSKDSPDGLWVTDTFSKSHRMSTYLVAYAVTNFESRSEGNISVWTRPGFAHSAEYALKISGKILRHYEDFFGIEYPLPKMDMIALPDFNAGAMENWGLITYRETAMLYDENTSSVANKQRVAVVVAHELAHQWFGNLVTPKWWDDLWLNEGFASYVEYIGVDHVEPGWRMLDQFVIEELQNVLKVDGLSSSHQISIPVNNPDEITEIFDHISYAKGASIIRMMNHFITEDVFKAGLRRYLRALRYSNAEQSDLWAHLTEAQRLKLSALGGKNQSKTMDQSPIDVEKVMNSWTLQTGYPLVTLTRQYDGSGKAKLDQIRYQPHKIHSERNKNKTDNSNLIFAGTKSSNGSQRWEIPITFTWESEQNWQPRTRLWMHQNESTSTQLSSNMVPRSDNEWMLLNINQVGYYRVNYDLRNWKLLIDQLNRDHKKITTTNRAQILDDIFELARSGVIDYRFAMEATKYLKNEHDYVPWDTVLMAFSYIDDMLQRTPLYGDWKDYIADLIAPYYTRYKDTEWTIGQGMNIQTNDTQLRNDVLEQYNQVNAIAWGCQVDDHCVQRAKKIFSNWKKSGKNEINPALRYTIYCTAIENGNKDDWDFLWKVYESEQNASERDRIMRALGCTKEIWMLARYLEWTFNKAKPIRRQDGAFVFRMIAKNNYGRDIAFNFLRERWSTIKENYGKSSFSFGNLIRSIATSMNTEVELNQLNKFYESIKNDVGTGKRSFQIAIEEVESNVLWKNHNYKILEDWIQEARSKGSSTKATI